MPRYLLPTLTALLLAAGCAGHTATQAPAPVHVAAAPGADGSTSQWPVLEVLPAHPFKLEIDGVLIGGFKEAYKDGDDPITHKRPGKPKYKNIVLKRGFVADPSLLDWYKTVLAGKTERKSGSIIYLDREGSEVLRTVESFECRPVRMAAKEAGYDVSLTDTLVLEVDPDTIKVRHDTVKNSIGNIR